ncbi:unnamed protein product [Vitrella brassicaformis CCMP3155]|uniref:Uncharacterized protein n=3 Tax=Vitrella brassicaformis TaxID=1169539 RepID=A0A0G4FHL7_VITBC|nr:unnamed protein product [Vitrella brassicaformis CCMP3155]|eukprot:CEM12958.1 unnamed protein product [Vitrella brassicaformis CCMP3155]
MSGADSAKRRRIDGPPAADHEMSGMSSQDPIDAAHDASAAGGSLSFEEVQRRFSVLLAQVTQVGCDVTNIEGSFVANVAAKVPSASSHWSTLKSSISAASGALTAITQGMAATRPPPTPPPAPHPSPPGAYAPTHTTHTGAAADVDNAARRTENRLPTDLYRDHIVGFLPISDAISPARTSNTFYGTELINEDFVLRRIGTDLTRRSLLGLIDVERPFQYYTKCAYALEHGGAVWCEWPDFIRLADIYKLTPSTGLPLIMSPQWMAAHLPTKADFHTMPLALRQYSTFGHLLNCKGTSLVLTKLDEADDGKKEGGGDGGDGGVTRQRYRIGVGCDVTNIEGSFVANVAAKVPSASSHWSTLKSSISAASGALTAITQGMAAMSPSPTPPSHPHPSPSAAHPAATHAEHTTADTDNGTANPLSEDLYRDVVTRFLPVDVAVSSARAVSKSCGTELVDETFVKARIDTDLTRRSLRGLIDVDRPFQYYTKCAYALEQGGAVWCEWPDFIRLADIYKLTDGLPLIMSPEWMAAHLPTKAHFHSMPLALRQYSTFGHLLKYWGTSLAIEKVDGAEEGNEGKKEDWQEDGEEGSEGEGGGSGQTDEPMKGDGGVTRQWYRIGDDEGRWEFETVPKSALPPRHPYGRTYDSRNPPIRYGDWLYPSFTAFMRRMVLCDWCEQQGVDETGAFRVRVGCGDERYQRLLTGPIGGYTTIDYVYEEGEGGDERERFIILKGTKEGDIAAYLVLCDGRIFLYTTEAEIESQRLSGRFPITTPLVRTLLTKHGLAHLIPE